MKLSILTASIPDRISKLQKMSQDFRHRDDIEWLCLIDNKKRSIGAKRNALLQLAQGEYVMWLDDDDELFPEFFEEVMKAIESGVDVICYLHESWINGVKYMVATSKEYENEQLHNKTVTVKRKPYTSDVWRRELIQDITFQDIMYGEDYKWAEQAVERVNSEIIINKPLHIYRYEDSETAAIEVEKKARPKTCVISFSSKGREDYNQALLGMIDSVKEIGLETDFMICSPDHQLTEHNGVTIHKWKGISHKDRPYGFKPALFDAARLKGYEQIIWIDSTVRILRNPDKALDYAGTNGFTIYDNVGHPLKYYIDEHAIKNLGATDIEECPQIMACVIVMDVRFEHVNKILDEWIRQADLGSFNDGKGAEKGHRHDQAILSYLLWKSGIDFVPYGQLCYPPHHESGEHEVIFLNKGLN